MAETTTTAVTMTYAFIGFAPVAAMTWFFSYRPRLFIRVFVPRDEIRGAARGMLRDPNFGRGMRLIALLQFGIAAIWGVIALWSAFG